jgi:hypothetical protein
MEQFERLINRPHPQVYTNSPIGDELQTQWASRVSTVDHPTSDLGH